MQLDELDDPFRCSIKSSRTVSTQAHHTVKAGRYLLSPTKIVDHFKSSKLISSRSCIHYEIYGLTGVGENPKVVQARTPQTPRHRDALSKKVPITPRHRVGLIGKPLTPRTPRTPQTPSNAPTIYNKAREIFARSADPGRLVGREEERGELHSFMQEGIETKSGRCLYVSGPPGTGKSALVSEVCRYIQTHECVKTSYINCMSVKSSKDIYSKLCEDLIGDSRGAREDELEELRTKFLPKEKSSAYVYVVTLDEIDHLLTLDLDILYTLFEWSLQHSSRLVLIGIANALDLTDRFLPRLKARNLKPQLLPFLPYTAPQIASVITTKLQSLSPAGKALDNENIPFLQSTAIQLCSKKVAAQTGDLRKAFDIIRRTIDLVEAEVKQIRLSEPTTPLSTTRPPLQENSNLCCPSTQPLNSLSLLTPATAPRATIAHIARIAASALSNGTPQRLQTLNLQQKAVLCALLSLEKSNRRSQSSKTIFATPSKTHSKSPSSPTAPTVRKLYETYCSLCKRENTLHPLTATEFADVISGLETLGLIGEDGRVLAMRMRTPGKKGKGMVKGEERRVVSWVGEGEVEGCLEGVGGGILKGLLRDE
jgi:cell division control protein 6